MYSLFDYGLMIADKERMNAYVQALRRTVKPGSVILDIGTGTGIFALLACQFGARRVYAIEPTDAIQVAREIAAANGYAERIAFIQNVSTRVTLPERADVIVSDLRDLLPPFGCHIPSIIDARERLLVPGGSLIPQRDTIWASVVQAPELYRRHVDPWAVNGYGLDMQAARARLVNRWRKGRVTPEQLLAEPKCWATLDYPTVESPDIGADMTWNIMRAGTAHGLSVWFDATLAEDVCFSNAPGEPELIYGSAFLPWPAPVALGVGDRVSVSLRADLVGEDYVWCWDTRVWNRDDPEEIKADFKQSTFFALPLSPARLPKWAADHVPALNAGGQIDRFILELMGEPTSLGDIARRVLTQFPSRFAKWQDAMTYVGGLSDRYSR